jgi:predicted transcriptional regulator
MAAEQLSRREREIVEALFQLGGRATAEEIRRCLKAPPTSSAVRAMLSRLEAKGAVRHREEGLRYVYLPTTPKLAARRSALQRIVRVFFGGSAEQAAAALLTEESWTDAELDALSRELERTRRQKAERKRS